MQMANTSAKEYQTSNMALCAYLLMEGFEYTRVIKVRDPQQKDGRLVGGMAAMCWPDNEDLQVAVSDFKTGYAEVEPVLFQTKIAFVRQILQDAVHGRDQD